MPNCSRKCLKDGAKFEIFDFQGFVKNRTDLDFWTKKKRPIPERFCCSQKKIIRVNQLNPSRPNHHESKYQNIRDKLLTRPRQSKRLVHLCDSLLL